ncbi:MAG: mechanosensitive ion channel family protein [Acidimicrobiia bacterium]
MLESFTDLAAGGPWSTVFVVLTVAAVAVAATRCSRFVIRRTIRRLAKRALVGGGSGTGLWRVRAQRFDDTNSATVEQRRRQRIDAASRMVNHLASLVIWIVAAIVAFHLLDVDPAFFLSSAGFLGAGLAIGGQHKVNDYLTGLSVHFEDRYGVGDQIVANVGWEDPVVGVVDHIGLFSTRVRDERSTMHFPNSSLAIVRNLSQEACRTTLRVRVPQDQTADEAPSLLRGLAGTDGLTGVVFLGDLAAHQSSTGEIEVDVATSRALGDVERARLVGRAEAALRGGSR